MIAWIWSLFGWREKENAGNHHQAVEQRYLWVVEEPPGSTLSKENRAALRRELQEMATQGDLPIAIIPHGARLYAVPIPANIANAQTVAEKPT